MHIFSNSGFAGHKALPIISDPADWYVWHFTPISNLEGILEAGELKCDDEVGDHKSVTDRGVRDRRKTVPIQIATYAESPMVSSHVPWYFASKSPTLFRTQQHQDEVVFLGMRLRRLNQSGRAWCASDGNAAVGTTAFSQSLESLGTFIDFPLMQQRMWNNTGADPDRMTRRAAETLVYGSVPMELVTIAACRLETSTAAVAQIVSRSRYAHVQSLTLPDLFY